ncbi:unnamed protein product [Ectocarpus sp. 12 AP-2014]
MLLGSNLFQPPKGFLGFALVECGAAGSTGCATRLIEDERCRVQALQQCDHERFCLPSWAHLRVLENAIVKAVEAGAEGLTSSGSCARLASGRGQECLRLMTSYGHATFLPVSCEFVPFLVSLAWRRILRLAIVKGDEGPMSAILQVSPKLLLQAERLHFYAGSQAAATQRTLAYAHLLGLDVQDVS